MNLDLAIARRLVKDYLPQLGARQFLEIADELEVSIFEVKAAWHFIQSQLNPYPAHAFVSDNVPGRGLGKAYNRSDMVQPDVVIRLVEHGFEAEVIERRRYRPLCECDLSCSSAAVRAAFGSKKHPERPRTPTRPGVRDACSLLHALCGPALEYLADHYRKLDCSSICISANVVLAISSL